MISPYRLGHLLMAPGVDEVAVAWVEGGGVPISAARTRMGVDDAGDWALAEGAVGVVARTRGASQGYWWGPGAAIPFNKGELLPLDARRHRPRPAAGGWRGGVASDDVGGGTYLGYWADRAWSSIHPGSLVRNRRLFDGELQEILDKAPVAGDPHGDDVTVSRYDMFLEGPPHLRGMIRHRSIDGVAAVVSDREDAVNPNFHAGPPTRIVTEPPE